VIVEYAPHGNLREFLRGRRGPAGCCCTRHEQHTENVPQSSSSLSYKDLLSFSLQVARGLDYMSSQMVNTAFYFAKLFRINYNESVLKMKQRQSVSNLVLI